jgi:hypothetical protein
MNSNNIFGLPAFLVGVTAEKAGALFVTIFFTSPKRRIKKG